MSKELFNKRKKEFIDFITKEQKLPRVWEGRFSDNSDMRLWFNSVSKLEKFKDFTEEIYNMLKQVGFEILSDNEKEQEFLNYINMYNQIPYYGEAYFSDNNDMHTWYMSYKQKNHKFETRVHNTLTEYRELDLASIWTFIKKEFVSIIKQLKRIPNHGEVIIQDGIDVRVIFDKLESFDSKFVEQILLHLQTYKDNNLSIDDRTKELLECVSSLGYVPYLQESRFSDGTDMFTWYLRYKDILPNLEKEIDFIINPNPPKKKVNIYFIPNFKTTGGKFYTICSNIGERLDLSSISSYEEAKELDDTLVKRGGLILKQDEEIDSVNFGKGKSK